MSDPSPGCRELVNYHILYYIPKSVILPGFFWQSIDTTNRHFIQLLYLVVLILG